MGVLYHVFAHQTTSAKIQHRDKPLLTPAKIMWYNFGAKYEYLGFQSYLKTKVFIIPHQFRVGKFHANQILFPFSWPVLQNKGHEFHPCYSQPATHELTHGQPVY